MRRSDLAGRGEVLRSGGRWHRVLAAGTLLVILAGCGSGEPEPASGDAAEEPADDAPAATETEQAQESEEAAVETSGPAAYMAADCGGDPAEWDALITAAQEEGSLIVYGPPFSGIRAAVPAAFENRFGISTEFNGQSTSDIAAKIVSEREADVYSGDVVIGGADSLTNVLLANDYLGSIADSFATDAVANPDSWVLGGPQWKDPDEEYILALSEYKTLQIVINTDRVAEGEITGWQDLLDPKWRGEIVVWDPRGSGAGANDVGMLLEHFGEDFIEALYVDQAPVFVRNPNQHVEDLVRGVYSVAISTAHVPVLEALDEGFPIAQIFPDDAPIGRTAGWGLAALLEPRPNPKAGELFVNWIACPEGNKVVNAELRTPSTRTDVSLASYYPQTIELDPTEEYWDTYSYEFITVGKQEAKALIESLVD